MKHILMHTKVNNVVDIYIQIVDIFVHFGQTKRKK